MPFIPKVVGAILVLAFGVYFARFPAIALTTCCRNVGIQDTGILGRIALCAIIVFVVIALDQVGIGSDIIRQNFLLLHGGAVLALALAFGPGGQKSAAAMLERLGSTRIGKAKNKS